MGRYDEGGDSAATTVGIPAGALVDLFAIGRCVERADATARVLDAHLQRMVDDPWLDEHAACTAALDALGIAAPPGVELARGDLMTLLAVGRAEPRSIAFAVGTAREHARHARDSVPAELWECLNTTRARMPRKVAAERAHEFLAWVRERAALAVGTVEGGASRDGSWSAFTLGRSIERAERTAGLLAARQRVEPWSTVLRSCGASEAALRTIGHAPTAQRAAALLLAEPTFPRSVLFALRRAEQCLADLGPLGDDGLAREALDRARFAVELGAGPAGDLTERMRVVRDAADTVADAVQGLRQPTSV
ncbi:alpha-E domain-containing protein [Arenivirga flava]|uniref:DUF403 domain-containing protein n=1 Tax=Arenivirga flava TaxID=1930060 RepID=A0AA37UMR6_9MICO|nr:alpha-E domain-containing protein [Arenivirga flava]GMA29120.1 hypothetical protein GCM10025874_23730 [Arenivirga flava]